MFAENEPRVGLIDRLAQSATGLGNIIKTAFIETDETQGSSPSYGDLATVGPLVTLVTGASVVVMFGAVAFQSSSGGFANASISVSGATLIAANDNISVETLAQSVSSEVTVFRAVIMSGLSPGLNTFKMQYRNNSTATWHWKKRSLVVIAI